LGVYRRGDGAGISLSSSGRFDEDSLEVKGKRFTERIKAHTFSL
jgi:hypothetical protein